MNSHHQLDSPSLSSIYTWTQSLGLSGSGLGRCSGLALHLALLVFWDWLPWEFEVGGEGAGELGVSDYMGGSSGSGVSGHSGGDIVTP